MEESEAQDNKRPKHLWDKKTSRPRRVAVCDKNSSSPPFCHSMMLLSRAQTR